MHLTILSQYYPPEVGAPQNRLSHLASQFIEAGHEVTVLTAMPNYPAGKIHDGYGGLLKRETQEGIRIIRTFIYPSQSAALLPRLLSYFSFVLSSALFGTFLLSCSDILLVESPPLFLGMSGIWLSRIKRARLIFNVSDLWPESAVRVGVIRKNSLAHRLGKTLESFFYRHAWLITGQSKTILEDIQQRFPAQKTRLLSNGADTNRFRPKNHTKAARARLTSANEFVVLYAGLHGLAQGLDQILDAAEKLHRESDFRFVFVGDGPHKKKLELRAREANTTNVTFLDSRPSTEMPELWAAADLIVVPLGMHIPGAVPSKLYEAMACGRPIILIARGEAAEVVERYKAGIVVAPGEVSKLVRAIRALRRNPDLGSTLSRNARIAAVEHFDRRDIAQAFIQFAESQFHPQPRSPEEEYEASLRA